MRTRGAISAVLWDMSRPSATKLHPELRPAKEDTWQYMQMLEYEWIEDGKSESESRASLPRSAKAAMAASGRFVRVLALCPSEMNQASALGPLHVVITHLSGTVQPPNFGSRASNECSAAERLGHLISSG